MFRRVFSRFLSVVPSSSGSGGRIYILTVEGIINSKSSPFISGLLDSVGMDTRVIIIKLPCSTTLLDDPDLYFLSSISPHSEPKIDRSQEYILGDELHLGRIR